MLKKDNSGLGGLLHLKLEKPSNASLGDQFENIRWRKWDKQPEIESITAFLRVLQLEQIRALDVSDSGETLKTNFH